MSSYAVSMTDLNNVSECSITGNMSNDDDVERLIQEESSKWLLFLGIAGGIPAILSSVFFSTASDHLGRKLCMILPLIGFFIDDAIFFFVILFELPLPVMLLGSTVMGVTGGFALLLSGCLAYIADITNLTQRTMRIVIAEMLMSLLSGLNLLGEGFLTQAFGFLPPLLISLAVYIVALAYLLIPSLLIETVPRSAPVSYKLVYRKLLKLLEFNENGRRWQIILLNLFIFFSVLEIVGVSAILVLYGTAQPFCWHPSMAGLTISFSMVISAVGLLIGMKIFSMCLTDFWLMQIGCLSLFIHYLMIGLARTTPLIFIALLLGSLKGMTAPVARSALSKITHRDDIGAMFAIIGALETMSIFVSGVVSAGVYATTVSFYPPLTFFLFAGGAVIPAALILVLQMHYPLKKEFTALVEDEVPVNTAPVNTAQLKESSLYAVEC